MSRGLMRGALGQATKPEELAQLEQLANAAAIAATKGIVQELRESVRESVRVEQAGLVAMIAASAGQGVARGLSRELGATGDGPLGRSLSATTEQMSASAVRGVQGEFRGLFPECDGTDRQRCIDERVTGLSRAMSIGFRDGLRKTIALPALGIAFVIGAVFAWLVTWAWTRRRSAVIIQNRPPTISFDPATFRAARAAPLPG